MELTLIQVAQITQDDDTPAAGRSPKQLKTLFKHLIRQALQQPAAPQVAAAKPETRQESEPVAIENVAKRPALKLSRLGMTFSHLRNNTQTEKTEEEEHTDNQENQPFTEDQLLMQWTAMCNRMPQKMVGIASRMKNMTPRILDFPKVEVVVDNQILLEEMKGIQKRIRSTLAKDLHNSDIELNIRLAEANEVKKILTKREQLNEMLKNNPALEKLSTALQLELV